MTNRNTRRGFTLIELLVVVLIIGILAAVALPQYNKAVKKAQGREALMAFDTYNKALAAYYLEHGTYDGITADTLGVQMPTLKNFQYMVSGNLSNEFQMGSFSAGKETLYLREIIPNHYSSILAARWSNGKLESVQCEASTSICESYFQCNWTSEDFYPCGNPNNCSNSPQTRCYL